MHPVTITFQFIKRIHDENLGRWTLSGCLGRVIKRYKLTNLRYADDITFIEANVKEMKTLLEKVEIVIQKYSLEINDVRTMNNKDNTSLELEPPTSSAP